MQLETGHSLLNSSDNSKLVVGALHCYVC